jgi:serine phosphatase RsbU (regulator of sigma subunit)
MTDYCIDTRPATGPDACGDFAGHVLLNPYRSAIFVGDVAGHGPAAHTAARALSACAHAALLNEASLPKALRAIDEFFVRIQQRDAVPFATLFVATEDRREDGLLHYASAGHEPGLVFDDAGRHRHLGPTGPALGLRALLGDPTFGERCVTLENGECLVVVTDGITEARRYEAGALHFFGSTGIVRALRDARLSVRGIANTIHQAAMDHARGAQRDDACIAVLVQQDRCDDTESSRFFRDPAGLTLGLV